MTRNEFDTSLAGDRPPPDASPALAALWWAGKDDWAASHAIVQAHEGDRNCDRVHAYLHRREGDGANARYWYRRAGRPMPDEAIEVEWDRLVGTLLADR